MGTIPVLTGWLRGVNDGACGPGPHQEHHQQAVREHVNYGHQVAAELHPSAEGGLGGAVESN